MLLDSNIIIYAAKPEHEDLRRLIAEKAPAVSAVSYVEVLGFHSLEEQERRHFEAFFDSARNVDDFSKIEGLSILNPFEKS